MFEQSFVNGARTKTAYSVLVSFLFQSILAGVAVLIPLIYTNPLPARQLMPYLVAPSPPPPPPRGPLVRIPTAAPPRFDQGRLTAPTAIPRRIAIINDSEAAAPEAIAGVLNGVQGGVPASAYGAVIADILSTARAVTPSPPPVGQAMTPPAKKRLKVGGAVQRAKQIYAPLPVYPALARQTRTSGLVRLSAVIGRDGSVEQLTVISGHPLLVPAALEAVAKWRYQPTLLNGEPVEVLTQIDVNFTLSR